MEELHFKDCVNDVEKGGRWVNKFCDKLSG